MTKGKIAISLPVEQIELAKRRVAEGDATSVSAFISTCVTLATPGSTRQARLTQLLTLPKVELVGLDGHAAFAVGQLLSLTGTSDVVDAHVTLVAGMRDGAVITSDPTDLRRLDPRLTLFVV